MTAPIPTPIPIGNLPFDEHSSFPKWFAATLTDTGGVTELFPNRALPVVSQVYVRGDIASAMLLSLEELLLGAPTDASAANSVYARARAAVAKAKGESG